MAFMNNLEKNIMLPGKEVQDTSVTIFYLFIVFCGLDMQIANSPGILQRYCGLGSRTLQ